MPEFSIRIEKNNKRPCVLALEGAMLKTLRQIGAMATEYASDHAPYDTGRLSESYKSKIDYKRNTVTVGSDVKYAPYVELGTGPNYESPPDWVRNTAERGHHSTDPWWYLGEDGEWHLGYFVRARPHLRPAFLEQTDEFMRILEDNLKNA